VMMILGAGLYVYSSITGKDEQPSRAEPKRAVPA